MVANRASAYSQSASNFLIGIMIWLPSRVRPASTFVLAGMLLYFEIECLDIVHVHVFERLFTICEISLYGSK